MSPNVANAGLMMGMPPELAQPTLALDYGDGKFVPLEYNCHRCRGRGKISAANDNCPDCKGRGQILSNQGRILLAFLKKWGGDEPKPAA